MAVFIGHCIRCGETVTVSSVDEVKLAYALHELTPRCEQIRARMGHDALFVFEPWVPDGGDAEC